MKSFSDKVRENRQFLGFTQEEFGALIGVTKRSVLAYETAGVRPRRAVLSKMAEVLGVSFDYLSRDGIDDPLYGMEKSPYVEAARERFGAKAAKEIDFLLERNAALFAGGDISQEAKDSYFEAVMKAYLLCKEEAKNTFGR
ncbi:MAG: helix-turn-helix domain-containing protein [Oscillospiraceae bacterium]